MGKSAPVTCANVPQRGEKGERKRGKGGNDGEKGGMAAWVHGSEGAMVEWGDSKKRAGMMFARGMGAWYFEFWGEGHEVAFIDTLRIPSNFSPTLLYKTKEHREHYPYYPLSYG